MLVVFAVLALVVVFVIAAVVIGRESHRLSGEAPRPVFDLDEAVAWVAERIPFEVAAELTHDDVRRMLRWNLADLQPPGEAARTQKSDDDESDDDKVVDDEVALPPSPLRVMGEDDAVAAVLARAGAEHLEYRDDHIRAVLVAHLAYLAAIGAAGPAEANGAKTVGDADSRSATMGPPEKGGGPAEQTL